MSHLKVAYLREHAFNSRWWGAPVGIVDSPDFFTLTKEERAQQLEAWAWVEFQTDLDRIPDARCMAEDGFHPVDTQLRFRIPLTKVPQSAACAGMEVHDAETSPSYFESRRAKSFGNERFVSLPGATQEIVDRRYALWSDQVIRDFPRTCLALTLNDEVQGWFLARPLSESRIELTLAMTAQESSIDGYALYHQAMLTYARSGWHLGEAGFSATNTAVHNIYAALGARFLTPKICFRRTARRAAIVSPHPGRDGGQRTG